MTKRSTSPRGIRFLMIAAAPVILGKTAMEAQLKKWSAKIVETRAGSGRTTATTGPWYGVQRWWRLIAGVLALALVTPGASEPCRRASFQCAHSPVIEDRLERGPRRGARLCCARFPGVGGRLGYGLP